MLLSLLMYLLSSNAVTLRRNKSILFSRIVFTGFCLASVLSYNSLHVTSLSKGIGIYGGLFNVTTFTQAFNIFILIISAMILLLTSFYPRKALVSEYSSPINLIFSKWSYNKAIISNTTGGQFRIIEYSLIIVFIIYGGIFLISTADIISVFLSIELQSYGLYILSTIYRDSEPATASGLTYFLLGGLSSCIILLGIGLIYTYTGLTNLDPLYSLLLSSPVLPSSMLNIIN